MEHRSTILIVDDDPGARDALEALLLTEGYQLNFAHNGPEALVKAASLAPDIILLDIMMPEMDGFEVCQRLRVSPFLAEVPIIMITALDDRDSRLRGIEAGADEFVSKPFDRIELRTRIRTIVRLNRYHQLLQERANLEQMNADLAKAYDDTLKGWSLALELRDHETQGHSERVTGMTMRLAHAMQVSADQLIHIHRGALLHDIGKMGIPDSILRKNGPLSDEEWIIMRKHPTYAYDLLSSITYLRPALDIPYAHHERWDGTGYPRGLKGPEIPLAARIFAVVDVWDALRSSRPYRTAWSEEQVCAYIEEMSYTHFDPDVVKVFLAL
jgi:putative two-component system response regulator